MEHLKPIERLVNSSSDNMVINNHRKETIFNNAGVPVEINFYYYSTPVVKVDLLHSTYEVNDGGWNTPSTARVINQYARELNSKCYQLTALNLVGTSYVPSTLKHYYWSFQKGVCSMFACNNHILISHIGKSCDPLKKFGEDSLTVHFDAYPSSLMIRQHAIMKGITLQAVIRNIKLHHDGLEIEAYDGYPITCNPVAVWFHRDHYYIFKFECKHFDVDFTNNLYRHVFVATKVYAFENQDHEFIFNMLKSRNMTSSQILNNYDLLQL